MPLSFLLIGIAWEELATVVGPEKAPEMEKMVRGAIAKDGKRFEDLGYKYEFMTYGTDEEMGRLETKLKEEKYDGICM
jgi:hypothetical protein